MRRRESGVRGGAVKRVGRTRVRRAAGGLVTAVAPAALRLRRTLDEAAVTARLMFTS
ncbi:hypothetical protein [Streptomyces hygroscopicus]|uniref:hypothetical protein n=1 Tax=Streptomyces hygroscopicus TaxID=1912 RepID=UPI0036BD7DDB